jgi:hypothetical protein
VSAFFVAKAKLDDAYARDLKKLCKEKPGAGMFVKETRASLAHSPSTRIDVCLTVSRIHAHSRGFVDSA